MNRVQGGRARGTPIDEGRFADPEKKAIGDHQGQDHWEMRQCRVLARRMAISEEFLRLAEGKGHG
jgi:hypothetical protein